MSFFTTIFFIWFLPYCKLFCSHLLPLLPSTTVCSAVQTCTVYVQLHLVPSVTSRGVYVACCSPTRTVAHAQYISKREIASIMINLCKETLSGFHQNLNCLLFPLGHAQISKTEVASIMILCTKKQMVFIAISLLLVCMACCPPSCTCLDF